MDRRARARAYYECLDGHDYERLASILAPEFVHDRPDMTLDGRDRFVQFMREERPQKDTSHPIDRVDESDERVYVQGRLLASDGREITRFVDVFSFDGEQIRRIRTYTR